MFVKLKQELKQSDTTLVAVSKTRTNAQILELYNQGQRVYGENRIPELVEKYETLPKDIQWHAIGSLQTNKVKYIAPFISLIHSIDSVRLLEKVNSEAHKNERIIDVLLQVKIGTEEAKHGFTISQLKSILKEESSFDSYANVRIVGLMGMASFTSNTLQVENEFKSLKSFYDLCRKDYFDPTHFNILSMGMSGDYKTAIDQGSNMVRIGSLLFKSF